MQEGGHYKKSRGPRTAEPCGTPCMGDPAPFRVDIAFVIYTVGSLLAKQGMIHGYHIASMVAWQYKITLIPSCCLLEQAQPT